MSKPWGGAGAWAAEAERVEAEEKERAAALAAAGIGAPEAFPSLVQSVSSKPKKKKQQQQTFSLSELTVGKYVGPGGKSRSMSDSRGLSAEEMMMLPTGPRERSDEEQQAHGGLGGGFRDYGASRGGADRMDRERDRGFGGGFERERESSGYRRERDRDEPSRADENSDWGANKKSLPSFSGGGGGFDEDRRGSRMSNRDLPSRADEVDSWGSQKKALPPAPVDAYDRRGGRGRFDDRREGFEEGGRFSSRADEADNWASGKKFLPSSERRPLGAEATYKESGADADRWSKSDPPPTQEPQRRRLSLAPRTRPLSISPPPGSRGNSESSYSPRPVSPAAMSDSMPPPRPKPRINPFGSARPREEILAGKGQDWRRMDAEYGAKDGYSRPSSSHSSRPATPEVSAPEPVAKPRPKVNPFGDAKPREVLLEEKGKDWRKIDFELEHRAVDRLETEEEKKLKEEIQVLSEQAKQEAEGGETNVNGVVSDVEGEHGVEEALSAKEQLLRKEKELEQLIRSLDDKVRFSQRGSERPGSRSGRADSGRNFDSSERPGSRSGRGDGRSFDSIERPGSRTGRGDVERSYASVERPGSQSGHTDGTQVYELPGDGHVVEVWTRASEERVRDRRGSWGGRDRFDDRDRHGGNNRR